MCPKSKHKYKKISEQLIQALGKYFTPEKIHKHPHFCPSEHSSLTQPNTSQIQGVNFTGKSTFDI